MVADVVQDAEDLRERGVYALRLLRV